MNYYRVTLADGVMHYLNAPSKDALRKTWTRDYPSLPSIKSIRTLRA